MRRKFRALAGQIAIARENRENIVPLDVSVLRSGEEVTGPETGEGKGCARERKATAWTMLLVYIGRRSEMRRSGVGACSCPCP